MGTKTLHPHRPFPRRFDTLLHTSENVKAPVQGNLNVKVSKVDPGLAADILQPLFTAVWEGEKVPDN